MAKSVSRIDNTKATEIVAWVTNVANELLTLVYPLFPGKVVIGLGEARLWEDVTGADVFKPSRCFVLQSEAHSKAFGGPDNWLLNINPAVPVIRGDERTFRTYIRGLVQVVARMFDGDQRDQDRIKRDKFVSLALGKTAQQLIEAVGFNWRDGAVSIEPDSKAAKWTQMILEKYGYPYSERLYATGDVPKVKAGQMPTRLTMTCNTCNRSQYMTPDALCHLQDAKVVTMPQADGTVARRVTAPCPFLSDHGGICDGQMFAAGKQADGNPVGELIPAMFDEVRRALATKHAQVAAAEAKLSQKTNPEAYVPSGSKRTNTRNRMILSTTKRARKDIPTKLTTE